MKHIFESQHGNVSTVQELNQAIADKNVSRVFITSDLVNRIHVLFELADSVSSMASCGFQFNDNQYYETDTKGKIKALSEAPEWAMSDADAVAVVSANGLDNMSFVDGMKTLSELPTDAATSILKIFLPNYAEQFTQKRQNKIKNAEDGKVSGQMTGNLTSEEFAEFIKRLDGILEEKPVHGVMMGDFEKSGKLDAEEKKGYRTYFQIITGRSMNPKANFKAPDEYFTQIAHALKAVKDYGIERAYNVINGNIPDTAIPRKTLTYRFNIG